MKAPGFFPGKSSLLCSISLHVSKIVAQYNKYSKRNAKVRYYVMYDVEKKKKVWYGSCVSYGFGYSWELEKPHIRYNNEQYTKSYIKSTMVYRKRVV